MVAASTAGTGDTGAVISGLEGLGVAEQLAAKNGISADILVHEQMGGKIETAIEDAMTAMKDLKTKLDAVLEYAGCDASATNCTGPKRVKKFKDLANEFFDPYENVVENVYDALMLAMTLGIDVNDVIMLLSYSCNIWGKYMCGACTYAESLDRSSGCVCNDSKNETGCYYRVATEPGTGKVSKNQPHCRLVDTLTEKNTVWREWIDANTGMTGSTQVACASDVIMDISLFRGMKKEATLDIDNLRRLVNQDSYSCRGKMDSGKFVLTNGDAIEDCGLNMCAVNPNENSESYKLLYDTVRNRRLPKVDKTAKSLCWETFDDAPRSVKNIDPTLVDVIDMAKITTSNTWEGTNISKRVGQDFGKGYQDEWEEAKKEVPAVDCTMFTSFDTCKPELGCQWSGTKCWKDFGSGGLGFAPNFTITGGLGGN